ncbi:hypothetical protein VE02_09984 [Pseudogymnoascus sp. 03VT05]|nr:hypothetical protein VE02_09984 [Pseudogymnoascus sp. 03VT05]
MELTGQAMEAYFGTPGNVLGNRVFEFARQSDGVWFFGIVETYYDVAGWDVADTIHQMWVAMTNGGAGAVAAVAATDLNKTGAIIEIVARVNGNTAFKELKREVEPLGKRDLVGYCKIKLV